MIHPRTEVRFVSEGIGYGVVAVERIPRGTITWVRTELDRTFSAAEVRKLSAASRTVLNKYAYLDGAGDWILCWDDARFMNHSCEPTCLSPGYDFDLAVRDIEPGEQLTCEYGGLNLKHEFACLCGAAKCRGLVRPTDLASIAADVDAQLRGAIALVNEVAQPLWPYVHARDRRALKVAVADPAKMCSSLAHYCGEPKPSPRSPRRAKGASGASRG